MKKILITALLFPFASFADVIAPFDYFPGDKNIMDASAVSNTVKSVAITSETDPTVPAWAKAPAKPTYTAAEVGAATSDDINTAIHNKSVRFYYDDGELYRILPGPNVTSDRWVAISGSDLNGSNTLASREWVAANALTNSASQNNSISILGSINGVNATNAVAIGYGATVAANKDWGIAIGAGAMNGGNSSLTIGKNAKTFSYSNVAIGEEAYARQYFSLALGVAAETAAPNSIAIGYSAYAGGLDAIAIGRSTRATASHAVQIGVGTNAVSGTLKAWDWPLLNKATGLIPADRISGVVKTVNGAEPDSNGNVIVRAGGGLTSISDANGVFPDGNLNGKDGIFLTSGTESLSLENGGYIRCVTTQEGGVTTIINTLYGLTHEYDGNTAKFNSLGIEYNGDFYTFAPNENTQIARRQDIGGGSFSFSNGVLTFTGENGVKYTVNLTPQ